MHLSLSCALSSLILLLTSDLFASPDCNSWLRHLAQEHHVSVIPKDGVKATNYKYIDLPNSPYRLAIPLREEKDWKVETRRLLNGSTFTVYNQAFGYSGEFDKEGNCLNSTGFAYDQMDRQVPQTLQGKILTFNYDWKACEQVGKITDGNKLRVGNGNSDQIAADLRKSASQDFKLLEKISKTAGTSPLYKPTSPSVSMLLDICIKQSSYLDFTIDNTDRQRPSRKPVQ